MEIRVVIKVARLDSVLICRCAFVRLICLVRLQQREVSFVAFCRVSTSSKFDIQGDIMIRKSRPPLEESISCSSLGSVKMGLPWSPELVQELTALEVGVKDRHDDQMDRI